jgi:hypothetical protein
MPYGVLSVGARGRAMLRDAILVRSHMRNFIRGHFHLGIFDATRVMWRWYCSRFLRILNPIILCDFEGNLVESKMYAELQAAS